MPESSVTRTLHTGRTVTLRYPDLAELWIDGRIPDVLSGYVEQLIEQSELRKGVRIKPRTSGPVIPPAEALDEWMQLNDLICCVCAVTPRVTADLQEARSLKQAGVAVLHLSQLSQAERHELFLAAQGVGETIIAQFLRAVSADAGEPLAVVPDGEKRRTKRERSARRAAPAAVDTLPTGTGGESIRHVGGGAAQ